MACIQSGNIFYLVNYKGNTAMDLSGGDNYSIIGFGLHRGPNQSWIFRAVEGRQGQFYIQSVGSSQYLAPENQPGEDIKVVVKPGPYAWQVEDDDKRSGVVRILAPGTPFCVDLTDYGNSTPGTPVKLYGRWAEGTNQLWKLEKAQ